MDALTLSKINDPAFFPTICAHVASGGALPELCELLKIKYSSIAEWIYSDQGRAAQYARALEARQEWTIQSILNELQKIALADVRRLYDASGQLLPPEEWPPEVARCVAAVETVEEFTGKGSSRELAGYTKRVKLWDKLRALELLGKHLKLYKEQIELSASQSLAELVTASLEAPPVQPPPLPGPEGPEKKSLNAPEGGVTPAPAPAREKKAD